jgi:hypothetical protein
MSLVGDATVSTNALVDEVRWDIAASRAYSIGVLLGRSCTANHLIRKRPSIELSEMTVRSRMCQQGICRSSSVVGTLWFIGGETELRCGVLRRSLLHMICVGFAWSQEVKQGKST